MKIPDWALTAAAWVYLHWRPVCEALGLALIVAAAAFVSTALAVAVAGVALLLAATFGGRSH